MAIGIAIGNVELPSHVDCAVLDSVGSDQQRLWEVYAGGIFVQFENTDSPTSREDFKTFLPMEGNTIRTYPGISLDDNIALVVKPIGFTAHEDQEFICSIEEFDLRLEPQSFPGVAGNPQCLVLYFKLAVLNGVAHRVGYNITLKTKRADNGEEDLNPATTPA